MTSSYTDQITSSLGGVRFTLRAEGIALAAICIAAYTQLGGSWGFFALLILAPDVFMIGYLLGNRLGALVYNIGHSTLIPAALGILGFSMDAQAMIGLALIWGAHIGIDRALGYGLKYAAGFKETHLERV
ncbi:DUF4260 domain-containing protein [Sulfitobacter sp. TSTF-M16]|uniref:DUF4260 domain-containing protein n=1 Tax=Sulfitobacter aestuariivivens TaxID=2766981 RepID=A0A927D0C9_9RHOB|nr:DUF4260 domain-containing protein [Sulfitobacter aestuariivivens]MBD3662733.1 DUF4260 domain-containing protein [Sulfitobacter aestuariivivens]